MKMNSNRKYGIGGSTAQAELEKLQKPLMQPEEIPSSEFHKRIDRACSLMKKNGIDALYLNAGTNLYYFTGTSWHPSERLVGAVIFSDGSLFYPVPEFEIGTFSEYIDQKGEILSWQEHESPVDKIVELFAHNASLAVDDSTPFNIVNRFQNAGKLKILNAENLIRSIRMIKSPAEIEQLQYAMDLTMQVQRAAARILQPGITTLEVVEFINAAHKKLGIASGSYFCIVLFGKDTSFPHGVKNPKPLEEGDMVLVDTGCRFNGYLSDITRTYCYGKPNQEETDIWNIEKKAQFAAFHACQIGWSCGNIDEEVRNTLIKNGLGPGYELPGLPHRTGHGIGLEIHEHPYILGGNETLLQPGMTFSIEPMLVIPDKFGIRLEDHVYMTEDGPKWFSEPALSIENPFGTAI